MKTGDASAMKSVWMTEPSPRKRAVMAKLSEECGELVAILGRCAAQGIDKNDPDTGQPNVEVLEEELADVAGLIQVAIAVLNLNQQAFVKRAQFKIEIKTHWLHQVPE